MPSLVRFLMVLALIGLVAFASMLALATFVHVRPRPMEQTIPASRLK